jgi:Fic family protein
MTVMKRPQKAPPLSRIEPAPDILSDDESRELAREYNERYLHWDKLQYYDCGKYGRESLWYMMRVMRLNACKKVDVGGLSITYNLLDRFQKPLHQMDMALSTGILPINGFDDKRKMMLSISSMMEESIASSQIEGAVTTTKEAKRMLRDNADPKNESELMILNNYRAMEFIRSNLDRELSPEFITELHWIVTRDTLEESGYEGRFREDDSVAVRDVLTGELYHEPVSHELIRPMIDSLCTFVNDETDYIHPIVKGILIHFITAYIHPFMDGNGRVSRSLFYWYTMKKGYSVMEYLSISKAIKEHKGGYEEAYQLSETDDNDVTYFLDYNIDMIIQSIGIFTDYLRRKIDERRRVMDLMDAGDITRRQADILASLMNSDVPQNIYELSSVLGVSPQTIRNDLNALIGKGYVRQSSKDGHKQRFSYSGKKVGQKA